MVLLLTVLPSLECCTEVMSPSIVLVPQEAVKAPPGQAENLNYFHKPPEAHCLLWTLMHDHFLAANSVSLLSSNPISLLEL